MTTLEGTDSDGLAGGGGEVTPNFMVSKTKSHRINLPVGLSFPFIYFIQKFIIQ
jgi:hypothetical protein